MLLEAAAIHYHVGEIQATCLSSQVLLSRHQDGTLSFEPITSSSVPAMLRHQPAHTIELPNARLVSVSMGINRHHVHVRMLNGHIDIVVSSRSDMAKWRDALQPMNASTAHTSTCSSQLGSLGPTGIKEWRTVRLISLHLLAGNTCCPDNVSSSRGATPRHHPDLHHDYATDLKIVHLLRIRHLDSSHAPREVRPARLTLLSRRANGCTLYITYAHGDIEVIDLPTHVEPHMQAEELLFGGGSNVSVKSRNLEVQLRTNNAKDAVALNALLIAACQHGKSGGPVKSHLNPR